MSYVIIGIYSHCIRGEQQATAPSVQHADTLRINTRYVNQIHPADRGINAWMADGAFTVKYLNKVKRAVCTVYCNRNRGSAIWSNPRQKEKQQNLSSVLVSLLLLYIIFKL